MTGSTTPKAALLAALATLALMGAFPAPAAAGGDPPYGGDPRLRRPPPARMLPPPEVRYRDPRFVPPPPRRARAFGPPPALIQAYLPRYTERPMYNEPPSRLPGY